MWPLPMTAMFGVVVCSAFTYTNGLFLTQMTHEFGWTRTQYASAFTLQMAFGLLLGPVTGKVIDRIGPRRLTLDPLVSHRIKLEEINQGYDRLIAGETARSVIMFDH